MYRLLAVGIARRHECRRKKVRTKQGKLGEPPQPAEAFESSTSE
jgi:hypothetical protein